MLQKVPQLKDIEKNELDDQRAKMSFEATLQSYHITMFYAFFNSQIVEKQGQKDLEDVMALYDKRYGRLTDKLEDALQAEIKQITKVNTFQQFFPRIGFPAPNN